MLRLATSLLLAATGGWLVWGGIDVTRYVLAAAKLDAETRPADTELDAADAAALRRAFTRLAGSTALRAAALEQIVEVDMAARAPSADLRASLATLLAAQPTVGAYWLTLAQSEVAAGVAPQQVEQTFVMSKLTTPLEGSIMYERITLGLALWPLLSDDAHEDIARDILDLTPYLTANLFGRFIRAAGALTGENKAELRRVLSGWGADAMADRLRLP